MENKHIAGRIERDKESRWIVLQESRQLFHKCLRNSLDQIVKPFYFVSIRSNKWKQILLRKNKQNLKIQTKHI